MRSILLAGLIMGCTAASALGQGAPPPEALPDLPKVDLWRGAVSGMTPEEVAEKFPKARQLVGDTLGTGFIERLRITPYDIDGADYAVKFFFDATVLRSVLLSLEPGEDHRGEKATTAECDTRAADLRAEYGEPVDTRVNLDGLMPLNRTLTFQKDGKEAILLCLGHNDHTSIVNLAFQPVTD